MPEAAALAETKGRPHRGQAEDGKGNGKAGGATHPPSNAGDHAGENAQSGAPRGDETERDAPGI